MATTLGTPLGLPPSRDNVIDDNRKITSAWAKWLNVVYQLVLRFQYGDIYRNAEYYPDGGTITINPLIYFHLVDTPTNVDVFLPTPADNQAIGRSVVIKRNSMGGNSLTIHNIERGNNVNLTTQDFYVELYSNGADWWIISERRGVFP